MKYCFNLLQKFANLREIWILKFTILYYIWGIPFERISVKNQDILVILVSNPLLFSLAIQLWVQKVFWFMQNEKCCFTHLYDIKNGQNFASCKFCRNGFRKTKKGASLISYKKSFLNICITIVDFYQFSDTKAKANFFSGPPESQPGMSDISPKGKYRRYRYRRYQRYRVIAKISAITGSATLSR